MSSNMTNINDNNNNYNNTDNYNNYSDNYNNHSDNYNNYSNNRNNESNSNNSNYNDNNITDDQTYARQLQEYYNMENEPNVGTTENGFFSPPTISSSNEDSEISVQLEQFLRLDEGKFQD